MTVSRIAPRTDNGDPHPAGLPPATAPCPAASAAWARLDPAVVDPPPAGEHLPVWSGPVVDDLGSGTPVAVGTATCWVLGVHGGAGASTVTALLGTAAAEAYRGWPDPEFGGPAEVVLVARVSALGLRRLRAAVRQWAAGAVPGRLRLRAAVLIPVAPGRIPRPLVEDLTRLERIVPAVHGLAWRADLVTAVAAPGGPIPRELAALLPDSPPAAPPTGRAGHRVTRRRSR